MHKQDLFERVGVGMAPQHTRMLIHMHTWTGSYASFLKVCQVIGDSLADVSPILSSGRQGASSAVLHFTQGSSL